VISSKARQAAAEVDLRSLRLISVTLIISLLFWTRSRVAAYLILLNLLKSSGNSVPLNKVSWRLDCQVYLLALSGAGAKPQISPEITSQRKSHIRKS